MQIFCQLWMQVRKNRFFKHFQKNWRLIFFANSNIAHLIPIKF